MVNALTIDVEDYFQVNAFARVISRDHWGTYPLRVTRNTECILELLDEYSLTATFFVLGWIAERCPELVRKISASGHEIASHGYGHELVYDIGPDRFRRDIRVAKALLEDITGHRVYGYRAPSYSITNRSRWAFEILVEEGYQFDSSIFPVHHDTYGIPDAPRFIHRIDTPSGPLTELPMTTYPLRLGGREFRLPMAGGGYLRLLPASLVRNAFRHLNNVERQPAILYFHPWEIDPDQPKIRASAKSTFRHYLNLRTMQGKLVKLLADLKFSSIDKVLTQIPSVGSAVR